MKANLWNVVCWTRGESPSTARILNPEPLTYREARSKAKSCRYIPVFFGCVLSVARHWPSEGIGE
jgi:hypothetical protein